MIAADGNEFWCQLFHSLVSVEQYL